MGWWSNTKPVEPSYSELGQELYRLLTDERNEWERTGRHAIRHKRTNILYDYWYSSFMIGVNGVNVTDALNDDDRTRLLRVGGDLAQEYENGHVSKGSEQSASVLRQALGSPPKSTFTNECKILARAVLNDEDMVAARALADRVIELSQEVGS
jgi:hypothetical protein